MKRLLNTKVSSLGLSVDPPNYNILSNWAYQKKLGFTPPHQQLTSKQINDSKFVCRMLFLKEDPIPKQESEAVDKIDVS